MLSIFVSSNEIIGFVCISSSPFVWCICIIISSDLFLVQHHTKTVQIGINAINRKIAIKQMKPDSTFNACFWKEKCWFYQRHTHTHTQKNFSTILHLPPKLIWQLMFSFRMHFSIIRECNWLSVKSGRETGKSHKLIKWPSKFSIEQNRKCQNNS